MMRSVLMKLCGVFEAELLVYYQHHKISFMCIRKYGTFCVPGRHKPGHGTSREIRDCWQPYLYHVHNLYPLQFVLGWVDFYRLL